MITLTFPLNLKKQVTPDYSTKKKISNFETIFGTVYENYLIFAQHPQMQWTNDVESEYCSKLKS